MVAHDHQKRLLQAILRRQGGGGVAALPVLGVHDAHRHTGRCGMTPGGLRHLLALMADDHDRLGDAGGLQCFQCAQQQRLAEKRNQGLRPLVGHALAAAGGEDQRLRRPPRHALLPRFLDLHASPPAAAQVRLG